MAVTIRGLGRTGLEFDMGRVAIPVAERIRARIVVSDSGCWLWQGRLNHSGYGQIGVGSRSDGSRRTAQTHRVAYEEFVGPIPDGLEIDHLCRTRSCCNPRHLEPVTSRVNTLRGDSLWGQNARKTHCPEGHPLSGGNLRVNNRGGRVCISCHRKATREAARRRRANGRR